MKSGKCGSVGKGIRGSEYHSCNCPRNHEGKHRCECGNEWEGIRKVFVCPLCKLTDTEPWSNRDDGLYFCNKCGCAFYGSDSKIVEVIE